jgi:hypothetical protein
MSVPEPGTSLLFSPRGLVSTPAMPLQAGDGTSATDRDTVWRGLEPVLWLAAILIGAAQQWASIDTPSSMDLVSYLDIGDAWLHGHWKAALNGYWNPLYSWILGLALAIVRPSARLEIPTVEAVDFAVFLLTLLSFSRLLRIVRRTYRRAVASGNSEGRVIPDWAWLVGGYTLFTWAAVRWVTLSSNTPDMLAAALSFTAWGIAPRLDEREHTVSYRWLGAVLALAYLSRTPMLFVGAALLAAMAWQAASRERRRGAALAAVVLIALSLPLIVAMSVARGHVTIGDNGKLNHAWLANPPPHVMPNRYWQGGPPGYGAPLHPVRVLWQEPPAYEFAAPVDGTYPPWTDPSYWYEGLTYRFDAAAEWVTVRNNTRFYWVIFGQWFALALAAVLLLAGDVRGTLRALRSNARYWAPPLVGLALYLVAADLNGQRMKLQPPHRYVAAFVVLLSLGVALSVRLRRVRMRRLVGAAAAVTLVAVSLATFWRLGADTVRDLRQPPPEPPWRVARALDAAGVKAGMRVATVGQPDWHDFWARLARVRIIADAPDERAFWAATPEAREAILQRFASSGAQAVVSWRLPPGEASTGWQRPPGTGYCVRRLGR